VIFAIRTGSACRSDCGARVRVPGPVPALPAGPGLQRELPRFEGTALTFANYTKMLGRPFYRTAIANTLQIGAAATAITTVLAVPLAFALARLPIPGKSAILAMASLPLILPSS